LRKPREWKDCPTSGSERDHINSVPYAPAVGSLMYAMVATRPNIAHAVSVISRFMHNLGCPHWNILKHIFRYLVGTKDYDIEFGPNEPSSLVGYIDSNYAGFRDYRKSTSRYLFIFGYGDILWISKQQDCTNTSTTEMAVP
jgi:hypothetical protein